MTCDCNTDIVAKVIDEVFVNDSTDNDSGNAKLVCLAQRFAAQVGPTNDDFACMCSRNHVSSDGLIRSGGNHHDFAAPFAAKPVEYRVLTQSRDIGHFRIDREGSAVSIDYDYKQNGRGPTIKETIKLDKDGTPLDWTITGRTTFGNAVSESFRRTGKGVEWKDLAGPGSIKGKDAPRYYVTQNGSPYDVAALAKALLAD